MGTGTSRFRRSGLAAVTGLAVLALAACGGQQYRYVESDDGHLFGKIPHDWEIEREGAVSFTFIDFSIPTDVDFAFARGDFTTPWRAEFRAGGDQGDVPAGSFETQHLDARVRDTFLLSTQLDRLRTNPDVREYERIHVELGDMSGYRIKYETGSEDDPTLHDEVFLMNDRRSGVYIASIACNEQCFDRYRDEIDDVLTGFWVEP